MTTVYKLALETGPGRGMSLLADRLGFQYSQGEYVRFYKEGEKTEAVPGSQLLMFHLRSDAEAFASLIARTMKRCLVCMQGETEKTVPAPEYLPLLDTKTMEHFWRTGKLQINDLFRDMNIGQRTHTGTVMAPWFLTKTITPWRLSDSRTL